MLSFLGQRCGIQFDSTICGFRLILVLALKGFHEGASVFGKVLYVNLIMSNQPQKTFHPFGGGDGTVISFLDGLHLGWIRKSFAIFQNMSNIFDSPPEKVAFFWLDRQLCLL